MEKSADGSSETSKLDHGLQATTTSHDRRRGRHRRPYGHLHLLVTEPW